MTRPTQPQPAPALQAQVGNGTRRQTLKRLQVELVKLQSHLIECNEKVLILLEGRDAAGKDGTIKRIVEHLSPRETRVVALGKPSDRDRASWYFQRWTPHLPATGEIVLFNRSWYNRAGVERVMDFCTKDEYKEFLVSVPAFEQMLQRAGIQLLKYYLDISRGEQKSRLAERKTNPLKQWKLSPIDRAAPGLWDEYTKARDAMLEASHTEEAPWTIVRADDKVDARINLIKDVLSRVHYKPKARKLIVPDERVVFRYAGDALETGLLAV
ncbi:polyphosphate kinase 2 [Roseateles saccharophilus]|jgi:polyphosphate kinase 2|uniref:ADP/GDP-polyphosphate phosphotransferase n=1 Tax=Roseateles saccharophilus TaxID=304 RepID=A0A4R3UU58_ROSSA|nr:polyphosphate kinase 2 [Roseateles saccharophilus]MDG0833184.1 polyphosphate kinase 2 [Roseateles saccharophilus]TCU94652.1 polyphosphate kinase 2 [Roseateles saccharophilus]